MCEKKLDTSHSKALAKTWNKKYTKIESSTLLKTISNSFFTPYMSTCIQDYTILPSGMVVFQNATTVLLRQFGSLPVNIF